MVDCLNSVRALVRDHCYLTFEAQGFGTGAFTWASTTPGNYRIVARRLTRVLYRGVATADDVGRLTFVVPESAIEPLTVEVTCSIPGAP